MRHFTLLLSFFFTTAAMAIVASAGSRPETCNNTNGAAWCSVGGGQPPYTYAWTGPNGYTATTDSIFGLDGGTYSVVITDNLGATATANTTVGSLANLPNGYGPTLAGAYLVTGFWGGACEGQCNGAGAFADHVINGNEVPYIYDVPATLLGYNSEVNGPVYGGFCYGEVITYSFTDEFGCTGTGSFDVYGVDDAWNPDILNIQGACTGGSIGSISGQAWGYTGGILHLSLDGALVANQSVSEGSQFTFGNLVPGTYQLDVMHNTTQCVTSQLVTVPDLGPDCGGISGNNWYDVDGDCVRDGNEVGIPGSVLAIEPGGYFAITNGNGDYTLNLSAGSYTLAQTDPTLVPICPASLPVAFSMNGTPVLQNIANSSTEPLDLGVNTGNTFARPGFGTRLFATARNHGPQVSGPVTVTCTYDAALTYLSATPSPTVSGNTLTWELPAFNSFGAASFNVDLLVPVATPLGTQLMSTWTVSNTLPDANPVNDTDVSLRTVTGSYDPNVKEVRTSSGQSGTQYFLDTDNYLDYTIHFQNTGTDTAFTVVVTDTLDAALDMASFQQGTSSHVCTVEFLTGRVVRWTFPNILLVDSTTNETGSHGLTNFRIRLAEPILPGTWVTNAADIFFDFNPSIRTPDVLIVTESSTGLIAPIEAKLQVIPNPAHDRMTVVGSADAMRVCVLAADGRRVQEHQLRNGHTWSVIALPAGLYTVQVFDARGVVYTARVVKQ
ncbi:MAG: T9SS type A sorting domain-containing protein [Flavobacteriales bacterium]|nr:T9SS type A sorting domain-containing protein [Flavobacteriales bacterium]